MKRQETDSLKHLKQWTSCEFPKPESNRASRGTVLQLVIIMKLNINCHKSKLL